MSPFSSPFRVLVMSQLLVLLSLGVLWVYRNLCTQMIIIMSLTDIAAVIDFNAINCFQEIAIGVSNPFIFC